MKKLVLFLFLSITNSSGYEPTSTPILITMKLQSSEILSDSEGYNTSPFHNSIPVLPKAQIKHNYVQDKEYKIRQISPTQFEVLGSPLSRAIDD